MRTMAEYANENEKKAKQRPNLYYDRKSRDRKLEVGQKVLILLPTHTSKLIAILKGPFVVTDKVNPVDYKIRLKELLYEYEDIFSDVPKVTNIIEHRVVTKTDEPIYKRSYPLPYALRNKVKQEIDDMLDAGATFVRMMDKVLAGYEDFADSFIDDIGISHLSRTRFLLYGSFQNLQLRNSALGTTATGIGAIACIPLSSLAVINSLGMMGLTVLSKRIHKKRKKHKDTVQLIRTSKSKIEDAVSKALDDDDDISGLEFTGIVTCLDSYYTEKQLLRHSKENTN
ncbi:unnamed protein product [Mytilus coruscus]|uniref:Uncharacterized protein n=1 Tax=Mytilus coruscus TaxID=42192 RepID=A0A6J8EPY2_MYTCO|nr:unnamed protein product [Mytilus coruscus]